MRRNVPTPQKCINKPRLKRGKKNLLMMHKDGRKASYAPISPYTYNPLPSLNMPKRIAPTCEIGSIKCSLLL
ncbi:hypothetical protein POVCU2_0000640 [Plasmodium ovale curtisi]|uniref:Uncharacterized protein n=1 Tax=Plasmodium ovale curtisi TaxID=864141 RepID=A0A1A8VI96_PLAOA|nr:hypothetical protein POVCU2_0000640 [Plasmodium ovale curtisi]SBS80393.1 hypothetical protein POVCU1_000700 [Plasmodium ovale curtisi]